LKEYAVCEEEFFEKSVGWNIWFGDVFAKTGGMVVEQSIGSQYHEMSLALSYAYLDRILFLLSTVIKRQKDGN
jgi:hypothetical protein